MNSRHPVLRAEALAVLIPIISGLIFLIYTFSTTYATNARVDRMEDGLKGAIEIMRVENRHGFDKVDSKLEKIIMKGVK